MATYSVKMLKDENGTLFLPLTSTTAVLDSSNNTIEDLLDDKQDTLVSGTNIKTINNNSLLGSGNITISGGQATDVQINGTSIVSSNTANIRTNGTYNASTNKIATMSDVPTSNATTSSAGLMSATDKTTLEAVNSYITGATNVTVIYPWDANNEYYQGDTVLHNNHFCVCRVNVATQGTYIQNEWAEYDLLNLSSALMSNINAFAGNISYIIQTLIPTLEEKSNKVTSISSSSTNDQYPSALAVYNYINSLNGNGVSY